MVTPALIHANIALMRSSFDDTSAEIKTRIDHLAEHGATPYAFNFQQHFTVQETLAYDLEHE